MMEVPRALSLDLRSRIVHACPAGELTQGEIAELFEVHLKRVEKLWRRWRLSGTVQAKPHAGGVRAHFAGREEDRVACWLNRVITLAQYVRLLWERHPLITSVPVLSRTLKALGLPRKKDAEGRRMRPT